MSPARLIPALGSAAAVALACFVTWGAAAHAQADDLAQQLR